jgi:hypothetical protein
MINDHFMAHLLNIPTRLRFWRAPVTWTMHKSGSVTRFTGEMTLGVPAQQIDGDQHWKEFLELREGDDSALFDLLNKVGLWHADAPGFLGPPYFEDECLHCPVDVGGRLLSNQIRDVHPEQIWKFRKSLKATLPDRKSFIKTFASGQTESDAWQNLYYNQFVVRFELDSEKAAAILNTVSLRELALAINYRDFALGAHYQICQRKDCPQPLFKVTNKHERKYCSQQCGHLESLRNKRREDKLHGKRW